MSLTWNGATIAARVEAAAKAAVDATTSEAVQEAERDHWWVNRNEQLEDEIVHEPAELVGPLVIGRFGTTQRRGFYGLILEYKQPFLRPAADRTFPLLASRLRARL